MLPPVSLAMAKATQPAAVAAPGPALLPELPSSSSLGDILGGDGGRRVMFPSVGDPAVAIGAPASKFPVPPSGSGLERS